MYVIGVVNRYKRENKDTNQYEYIAVDSYGNYNRKLGFSACNNPILFNTAQAAKNWWEEHKLNFVTVPQIGKKYDWSTLRLFNVLYLKADKLSI
jgi:hypothetical protein